MKEEFLKENIIISGADNNKIHSPIGLDIGAETPDEIAISILAEIHGKFANRSGGFLKYRCGPIHQRDSTRDQVFKQVYLAPEQQPKSEQTWKSDSSHCSWFGENSSANLSDGDEPSSERMSEIADVRTLKDFLRSAARHRFA